MTESRKKIIRGKVVSDKMEKTVVVESERLVRHPFYEKVLRKYTHFFADNPQNQAKTGDEVEIIETRPLSKMKRWRVLKILSSRPTRQKAQK